MADVYMERIIDGELKEHLEIMGAVLIEGPKWCGKTRTSKEFAKSLLSITNKNQIESLNLLLENGSFDFLDGTPPMLVDEWQLVPGIWDAVRTVVDDRGERGQFILTGSWMPPKNSEPLHSGAGRIGRLTMRTMSLFESKESNGAVSLKKLFDPDYKVSGHSQLSVMDLATAIARGGWPESIKRTTVIESIISLSYSYLNGNPNLQADRKRNSFYHLLKKVQKIFCPIMEGSDVQE